jgi:hypothetical protein
MPRKSTKTAGGASVSKGRIWRDSNDAPEITGAMLDRATVVKDGKVIQRGRPLHGDNSKYRRR